MKNVLDCKELWETIVTFFCEKNAVFLQISIGKNNRIISDVFDLSEEFSTFLKMMLGHSMSSQMNII